MAVTAGASIYDAVFIMGEKFMKLALLHTLLKDPVKSSALRLFQKCVNCLFDGSLPFCILTFLIWLIPMLIHMSVGPKIGLNETPKVLIQGLETGHYVVCKVRGERSLSLFVSLSLSLPPTFSFLIPIF